MWADAASADSILDVRIVPSDLVEHIRSPQGRKKVRYAAVSLFFVPLGQILIQVFVLFYDEADDTRFTKASLITAAILTLPNFFANKYYVWKETSKDKLRTQVLVFWVAAMLGTTLATLLTLVVESFAADANPWVERGAVFCAQLLGFGLVWVARFLVLDRWLFKATHHGEEPPPELLDELHHDFPV